MNQLRKSTRAVMSCVSIAVAATVSAQSRTTDASGFESDDNALASGAPRVETVTVTAQRVHGYRATVSTTANKTSSSVKETPFSLQVVTRDLLEDRGVANFGEAVRTVPGVTPQVGFGGFNYRFRIRGFATPSNLKNGFRRNAFTPFDEIANVEQIEVLKGPASALYGRFEPGGVVNIVTRKPLDTLQGRLDLTTGRYDFQRTTFDATGPLGLNGVAWRVTGAYEDAESFRDFVDHETKFIAPVVQWKFGEDSTLTAEFEHAEREGYFDRGFGNHAVFLTVPIERQYGERDAFAANRSRLASLVLDHGLNDTWRLRFGALVSNATQRSFFYGYGFPPVSGLAGPNPMVNRRLSRSRDEQDDETVQLELTGGFSTGSVSHRVLLGAEYSDDRWAFESRGAPITSISLNDPIYGGAVGAYGAPSIGRSRNEARALYFQDEMRFGEHWTVLAGARYDDARFLTADSFITGSQTPLRGENSPVSPRLGVTYTPASALSLYASWGRSFRTEIDAGRLRTGTLPDPSEGRQIEAGAKLDLLGGRLTPTFAVFELERSNGLVPDPDDPDFVIALGEQRSRGFELDVPWVLSEHWRLLASATYAKSEITADTNVANVGLLLANAPKWSASFWSTYDFSGALAGLSAGLGANHVGRRAANNANSFFLPSYTRWDANVAYRFAQNAGAWKVQLDFVNATDERYYDSGGGFVPTYPGAPRTWSVTVGYAWR